MKKRIMIDNRTNFIIKNKDEYIVEDKYTPYPHMFNTIKDCESYYSKIYSKNPTHILDAPYDEDIAVKSMQEGLLFIFRGGLCNIYNLRTDKYFFQKDNNIYINDQFYNGIAIYTDGVNHTTGLINRFGKILLEFDGKYNIRRVKGNFHVYEYGRIYERYMPIKGCKVKYYSHEQRKKPIIVRDYSKGNKVVYNKVVIDMSVPKFEYEMARLGYIITRKPGQDLEYGCYKLVFNKKYLTIYY